MAGGGDITAGTTACAEEAALDPAAIVLRPGGEADLDILAAFYVQLSEAHGQIYTPAAAREKLAKELRAGHRAVVVEASGEPLGFVTWIDLGDHVLIRQFVLGQAHRRQGLGRALFARLRHLIGADREIRLQAAAGAPEAFWRAMGFGPFAMTFTFRPDEEPR